jgi:DNA-binding FrmR family transcriptional regulator
MKAAPSLESLATLQPVAASSESTFGCGCVTRDPLGVDAGLDADPVMKDRNLKRLKRIEGQVRGLQRMVDENRYCADILTQISSAHEALRAVGRELMRKHLKHCATAATGAGNSHAEPMYDELIEMMYKLSR